MIQRRKTRQISLGSLKIGGDAPISVQSMTKTDTRNIRRTVRQIRRLEEAGCEIVRVAVVDEKAAHAIAEIKKRIRIPVIADIHFHYRLALKALESGADGLRINPGNIGGKDRLKAIVEKAKERSVPIRIGINAGSVEKDLSGVSDDPRRAMVQVPCGQSKDGRPGFRAIKVSLSLKRPEVEAYRLFSKKSVTPSSIVTEAGRGTGAIVKSAIGIGLLLQKDGRTLEFPDRGSRGRGACGA
jgi:(E)-4-hydroxy-3-methylbut-2-enyl-diphosphate synthase